MPLFITHACVVPQGFESNALGAFGGGPESTEAWRKRVDAQDAFSAAAQAALGDLEAHAQVSFNSCPILPLDSPPYMR